MMQDAVSSEGVFVSEGAVEGEDAFVSAESEGA